MKTEYNPYVVQMDKFAASLHHLSDTFLKLEEKRGLLTQAETENIFLEIDEKVCKDCEKRHWCMGENAICTYQMVYEILSAVEESGLDLDMEIKKKLQKKCIQAPRFLRETLEVFQGAKRDLLFNNRLAQNREGCAVQLDSFAKMIRHATRELDAAIFSDEALEKRMQTRFLKLGVRLLSSVFLVTPEGKYEIHVTVRSKKGQCVTTKELIKNLSAAVGRKMIPEEGERPIIGQEYCTIVTMEGPGYHTLQGVAKIGKGCEKISGDNFSMLELPGGKNGIILSDGMGSGEKAFQESAMVVEMLEELLTAGFPKETAIQMMNTALVMGREEIRFSTIDMSVFDLYTGKCEFVKAGASTTYIKRGEQVERISSTSLPIGVVQYLEIETTRKQLKDGDFVIMVTDGVLDSLPVGEQDLLMEMIIGGTKANNPKEMAHYILEQVLEWTGEEPLDDMTVAAAGIWKLEK